MSPNSIARPHFFSRVVALLLRPPVILLVVVGMIISRGMTTGELHFYNDEMRHAMNGVFVRDLLVDRPLAHPMEYAREYFAKYPAIALPHWPPFFSLVEGMFFLILGISVWVSRLTVLTFALLGVYFWYCIAERYGARYRAVLSAFIFSMLPLVLLYERVTMLEIPQVAMCLGAIHFWLRWLDQERTRDLWLVAAFSSAALLTSQLAIFLVFIFGFHFFAERRFRLLRNWKVWAALAASFAVVFSWYLLSFRTLTLSYQRGVGNDFRHMLTWHDISFYIRALPQHVGWILLPLAVVGLGWTAFKAARQYRFFLLWVISAYVCFLVVQEKEPRHIMIWIPPLVYFALLGVEAFFSRRRWILVASIVLAVYFLVGALRFERPKVAGLEDVARYVLAQPGSDIVYYQGELNGDFIFFVRKFDPEKSHMVAREKQVVVSNIVYDRQQVLKSSEQILSFFRNWAIHYVVVEDHDPVSGLSDVDALIKSDQFELLRVFHLWSNDPRLDRRKVSVYRLRGEVHRTDEPVTIPMMTIHSSIRVNLNRVAGRPWPN